MTREDQVIERRQALMEAAVSVIAKRGLIGLTMREIADEAQCSYGVVSFHFNSKEGVILAALDHMVEEYDRILGEYLTTEPGPAGRIRAMIESDFDGRITNSRRTGVWAAFWAESVRNEEYRKRCGDLKIRYNAILRGDIAALAAERAIDIEPDEIVETLDAMTDGLRLTGLIMKTDDPSLHARSKELALSYLRRVFPDDF